MCALHIVYHLVDVTRTKVHDPYGPVLIVIDSQARDDSWMGHMFGMVELQLQISGRPVTEEEMDTLADLYLLTDNTIYMCWMGPTLQEPIDDDDTTTDDEDDLDKDSLNVTGGEFGTSDDEAQRLEGVFLSLYFALIVH